MTTGSTATEGKAMYNRLSRAILTALAIFTGAVALSMSTSGTLSDIGFFIYAAALVLLAALAVAWLIVRLRLRTARRRPDATTF
jgi:FtsH-binding integral membrane protein